MLVLSRRVGETVVIGPLDDKGTMVTVMVVDRHSDKVRIGVEAPKEIEIHRLEVYLANLAKKPITPLEGGQS